MTVQFALNPSQLAEISALTNNGTQNYYMAYNYVYNLIKDNSAISNDTKLWFQEASAINSNDLNSPSNVYIRSHTAIGMAWSGNAAPNMQAISNAIGASVYNSLQNNAGIPQIDQFVNLDIGAAINSYGLTPAGWGGSIYYWNTSFSWQGENKTVGQHILSRPAELEKFIATSAAAMNATYHSGAIDTWAERWQSFDIGTGSDVPEWVKVEILNRAVTHDFNGDPNVVSYNGETWYYNSSQDQWHALMYRDYVAPSVVTRAFLDDLRDVRLNHQTNNFDTYNFSTAQLLELPYVYNASSAYSIIRDLGWQNSNGTVNLQAFLDAGNGDLSGAFFNANSNDFYIAGVGTSFSLSTPYLDSLVQSGFLNPNGILQVSQTGFLGGIGQAWADVASGRTSINDTGAFASETFLSGGAVNGSLKNFDQYVDAINQQYGGNLNDTFRDAFGASAVTDTTNSYLKHGNALNLAQQAGGTVSNTQGVNVIQGADNSAYSIISQGVTVLADGATYALTHIVDTAEAASKAVASFINDLADEGTKWFSAENGAQESVGAWLAANVANILNGNLSAGEAFLSLGRYLGASFLPNYVINTTLDAQTVIARVLHNQFGVGTNPIDAQGKLINSSTAAKYAGDIQSSLVQIGASLINSGFNVQQATNVGIATFAGKFAATFLVENKFVPQGYAGDVTVAVSTAVTQLVSGNFNGNFVQLGLQIGLAVGLYELSGVLTGVAAGTEVGKAITAAFVPIGIDPTTIAISILISFVGSKILGGLFGGKKSFGPGEFPSVQALYNSIYQVQTITVDGQQVPALVAVNAQGSTIIASGNGIGYIIGNVGADVLVGDNNVQTITGNAGSDYLEARGGNDNLIGGDGNEHLNGGDGNDILQGDAGEDIIFGEEGVDTVIGGAGSDFIHLGSGDDIAASSEGNDYVLAGGGNDAVAGGDGNDSIDGGYGDDSIQGDAGNDLILGNLGHDAVDGGDGSDTIFGDVGNDQLSGGNGNDFIDGGAGIDILNGDAGRDILVGGDGDDFADGGLGDDYVIGGTGNDVLLGGLDNDYLRGDAGNDSISGGFGNDIIVGSAGSNTLEGGEGSDIYVIGVDATEHSNIIIDDGALADSDTIMLSWLTSADAQANLTLQKNGDDLVVSNGSRVLASVAGHFQGRAVERIELSGGDFINLAGVNYDVTSHLGAFSIEANQNTSVLSAVAVRESEVQNNLLSKELYWNNTFLDKLSQLAYDEQLSDQTAYTFYDGTNFQSFRRSQGKFGGKYSVYKLDQPGSIAGTEFTRLEYAIQDAEDQSAATPFGTDKTTLAGPYESLINGANVVYSTIAGKNIQDIVVNGVVLSTKVAGESTLYSAGGVVYGSTYAQRLAVGSSVVSDVAVKKQGGDLLVGAYWNEFIDGKSGDDILIGNGGADGILGGDGNDWVFGGEGNDSLYGGNGDDVVFGGEGNDLIGGGANDDAILAGAGEDTVAGDTGSDWIDAGSGNDNIDGGDGDDIIIAGDGNDTLIGGAGDDILHGDAGNDAIYGDAGNDTLIGGFGSDSLYGGAGNDVLNGDGGAILLDGGDGQDLIVFTATSAGIIADLQAGTYSGPGGVGLTISNFENLTASSYNDTIYSGSSSNIIDGGDGVDTVTYTNSTVGISVNLRTGINTGGYADGDTLRNIERVVGSASNDLIIGDSNSNLLSGGVGNDTLEGGFGADTLTGGSGADVFAIDVSATTITITDFVRAADKIDVSSFIYAEAFADLIINQVGADAVISVPRVTGNAILTLIGVAASALDASDFIFNTSPRYILNGSVNPDTYVVTTSETQLTRINGFNYAQGDRLDITAYGAAIDDKSDISIVQVGSDTVLTFPILGNLYTTIELTGVAAASITNLYFLSDTINYGAGTNISYGAGNDNANGTIGNDTIWGYAGNDMFSGSLGNDQITGMAGNDSLYGGYGNDWLAGDAASEFNTVGSDYLDGGSGNDTLLPGGGNDTVYGGDGNDLVAIYENVVAFGNTVYGGNGNDALYMSESADLLYGDSAVEGTGDGNDTIVARGGADTIYGGGGNDSIDGGTGNDSIIGGSGNDTIDGGAGNDSMIGGAGNDTYYVDSASDVITESLSEGIDTVISTVTYTLGANIENLTLAGTSAINATGNNANNIIIGNAGVNTLRGYNGDDSLDGADGNDALIGDAGSDTLVGGNGIDSAYYFYSTAAVTVSLALATAQVSGGDASGDILVGIENLHGSVYGDLLTGDSGTNLLWGFDGNDSLNGGAGNDTMVGGIGNDTYYVDVSGDVITEDANEGTDSVVSAITYVLGNNFENLTLSGSSNINATGNALNNILVGNSGNNIISGGVGNDTLTGGAGNDSFIIGLAAAATTISDFVHGTDKIDLGAYGYVDGFSDLTIAQAGANTTISVPRPGGNNVVTLLGITATTLDANDFVFNAIPHYTLATTSGADILTVSTAETYTAHAVGFNFSQGDRIDIAAYGTTVSDKSQITINQVVSDTVLIFPAVGGKTATITLEGVTASSITNSYFLSNTINYGAGVNSSYGASNDNVIGSAGNDTIWGNGGNDTVTGATGNDLIIGMVGNDYLYGGYGNDSLTGDAASEFNTVGHDYLEGGSGNDQLLPGGGNDTVYGGDGNDLVSIYENVVAFGNTVYGGNGDDGLYLSGSADLIYGDNLTEGTGDGNDIIFARGGNDSVYGGGGNDSIEGEAGNDLIYGGTGNDSIIGGAGADSLTGGLGSEIFVYKALSDSGIGVGNRDIITDFNQAQGDKIDLSAFTGTFAFLGTGAFTGGTTPQLRYVDDGTNTIVQVNTNNDAIADFEIQVNGHLTFVSGDFVL